MSTPPHRSSAKSKLLSIVVPCYNEELCIEDFYLELSECCQKFNKEGLYKFEFIFVNDGSEDKTQSKLRALSKNDKRVRVLEFSRNFGKEAAITAGLKFSSGDFVVPIDADLQHPPELIFIMLEKLQQDQTIDFVTAKRKTIKNESVIYRTITNLFYTLENFISPYSVPKDVGDFRLMKRNVVDALNSLPEKRRFMKGLYAWAGFSFSEVYFDVSPRKGGRSKFTPSKLFSLAADGIFDFSVFPLRIWMLIGILISLLSFFCGCYIVVSTIFFGDKTSEYTSLMVAIFFFGGIQLISIGVLGEYIGRIFSEVKGRPSYILKSKI